MASSLTHIARIATARGYGALLSLVTLIVSARYLGPDGRGIFVAAITWTATFCTLFHMSVGPALQYRLQQNRLQYLPTAMLGTFGGFCVLASTLGVLTAICCYLITEGEIFRGIPVNVLVLAFAALPFMIWEQYSSNIYASLERTNLANRAQYIGRTLGVLAVVILVGWLDMGVIGALWAMLLTQAIVVFIAVFPLLQECHGKLTWLPGEFRPLLNAGAKLHLGSVSAYLLDQASVLIVNNYLPKAEVGFFQLSLQLVGLILILPQSALMILYGEMAKSDPSRYWLQQRKLILRILGGVILVAVLASFLAPALIPLVAGEDFHPSVSMFIMLLPSLLGSSLSILLTPQWLGRGLFTLNILVSMTILLLVVCGTLWCVPRFGVDGAIAVRVTVYGLLLPCIYFLFWRWCNRQLSDICSDSSGA